MPGSSRWRIPFNKLVGLATLPEPLWFNESLDEWTIYGVTYDRACMLGWGGAWFHLMNE